MSDVKHPDCPSCKCGKREFTLIFTAEGDPDSMPSDDKEMAEQILQALPREWTSVSGADWWLTEVY